MHTVDAYCEVLGAHATAQLLPESGLLHAYRSEQALSAAHSIHNLRRRRAVMMQVLDDASIARLDPALDLNTKICSFIDNWNADRAHPFVWIKTADQILAKANRPTTSNSDH